MRRETTQPGTPYAAGVESDFLSLLVCASSVRETDKSGGGLSLSRACFKLRPPWMELGDREKDVCIDRFGARLQFVTD